MEYFGALPLAKTTLLIAHVAVADARGAKALVRPKREA